VADEVFVGRRDEQAQFAALLKDLAAARKPRRGLFGLRRSAGVAKSPVVLVCGLGGIGKSRLLRQFQGMAEGRVTGSPVKAGRVRTVWLDWEDKQRDDPGSYTGEAGPSLVTVLDAVQQAVIAAVGDKRAGKAFRDYRQGAARMPEYAARFEKVVAQSGQAGSSFTAADAAALAKAGTSAGLLAFGHPGGLLGFTPSQMKEAAQAGVNLSDAAVRAVTGKKRGVISPQEYDLVTDPSRELPRRAAAAVRTVARKAPLVIFLDTGEVISEWAWGWLRRVMTQTGPRVAWVVGARFETEEEAGADSPVAQFVQKIGDEFLVRMSPARFDDEMIRDYLQARPNAPSYTDEQIALIARFTHGLPLAVSLTAALLDEGQPVEKVCQEAGDGHPGSVASQLARRYLVHAEGQKYTADDPRRDDVTKILGLALAYGDLRDDPGLLAKLWNVQDPLAAFQDLARRHDFVLPVSRRLHDDVRDALRTDLLDPWRRPAASGINERAIDLFKSRLAEMRGRWPTLDDQLAHTRFTTTVLAVLWHTLWIDNRAGLDLFIEVLPVLAVAAEPTAEAAAHMMEQFAGTFDEAEQEDLDLLTRFGPKAVEVADSEGWRTELVMGDLSSTTLALSWLPESLKFWLREQERPKRWVRLTASGLALRPPDQVRSEPLIGERADREVAVTILLAIEQGIHPNEQTAIATLEEASAQTASLRFQQYIRRRVELLQWASGLSDSPPQQDNTAEEDHGPGS
jgi:hypothetical protein